MKILIVRFSSIGDIVLTSSVVRCLNEQLKDAEIHFLTKNTFRSLVEPNEHISKVFAIEKSIDEVIVDLKSEKYDWVIDLHNNVRTKGLKWKLRRPSKTFRKLTLQKLLLVNFKKNKMPKLHVVDRYFETVAHLGVKPDGKPGDFFIETQNKVNPSNFDLEEQKYVAIAIGAQHSTKRLPTEKLIELIEMISQPVVLVGGPTDAEVAKQILNETSKKLVDTCGKLNLQQSASLVKQSAHLITHDTGMMHIASCLGVKMSTVWGNTVPAFGMTPYAPGDNSNFTIHEVEGLSCRPCSKIGHAKCPKGHFKCMMEQNIQAIVNTIK